MPVTHASRFLTMTACLICVACSAVVGAAEPEVVAQHTREFDVYVDGKPRGSQTMTFQRRSNGTEVMRGNTEVIMKFGVFRYRFASQASETWKDGRIIQLTNEATFNGDKFVTQGAATQQALHYEVNGESRQAPADVWVASYWREPDVRRVGQKVTLLNADKGRQLTAVLEKLEPEVLTVDSAEVKASHYRMSGDVEVEVWYDRHGYVVRQELIEAGHRTVIELTKITRGGPVAARPDAGQSVIR